MIIHHVRQAYRPKDNDATLHTIDSNTANLLSSHIVSNKYRKSPVATMVAYKDENDVIQIRVSVCHKADSYNRKKGVEIALQKEKFEFPLSWKKVLIARDMEAFLARVNRYFKPTRPLTVNDI
jgi:hypothetical protein